MKNEKIREVIVERKVGFSTKEVIAIVLVTLVFGTLIGSFVSFKRNNSVKETKISSELSEFLMTYDRLTNDYYEKVDKDKLINIAIKGMIESLGEEYTVYMDKEESLAFSETVDGEYYGLGALITKIDNKIIIAGIFKDSPAEKAKLKIGDQIINIDGKDITEDMSSSDVTDMIKSKVKDDVIIKVIRDGNELEIKAMRDTIDIPSVGSKVIEKNGKKIGYLVISVFASNSYDQFKDELNSLEKKKIDGLIIDVRSNPGGHLTQVTKMINTFVPKDSPIYKIKSKGKIKTTYSTNESPNNLKVALLVNSDSASASELLTIALKEMVDATIVGTKTYGKGTVQKAYSLSSGAIVKYTSEEWLSPKGNSINKEGIVPDIDIDLDKTYYENPTDENDNQLQKALETITK